VNFLGLYLRVLKMLGTEARLGWVLAFANLLLAAALFAEPMLFGRIIDTLGAERPRVDGEFSDPSTEDTRDGRSAADES